MAHMVDLTHTERVSLVSELALEPSRSDFIVLPQAGAAAQADSPSAHPLMKESHCGHLHRLIPALCASSNEGVTLWVIFCQADSHSAYSLMR